MENAEHRHDVFTGRTKPRKLNQNELIYRLHSLGMVAKGCKADIVSKGKEDYIPVEENYHKKKEGWIGKPKGMFQVLWERGWIDTSKLDYYTIRGKRDEKGNFIQETSLLHLMDQCKDFL